MRTQRTQVSIESRQQIRQDALQFDLLFAPEKIPFVGAPQEVSGFIKRTTGNTNEALMVGWRSATIAFGYIRANAVGRSDKLMANSGTGEWTPRNRCVPDEVSQLLGQSVNLQAFERKLGHG